MGRVAHAFQRCVHAGLPAPIFHLKNGQNGPTRNPFLCKKGHIFTRRTADSVSVVSVSERCAYVVKKTTSVLTGETVISNSAILILLEAAKASKRLEIANVRMPRKLVSFIDRYNPNEAPTREKSEE